MSRAGCARFFFHRPAPRRAAPILSALPSSEDDVVQQSRLAHPYCADRGIAWADEVHPLKRVRVHRGEVAWRKTRNSLEHSPADCLEGARAALALVECITK